MQADALERLLDVLEFGAKAAIALGAVWAFIEKVGKPVADWRRRQKRNELREVFAEELQLLASMAETGNELAEETSQTVEQVRRLFSDLDNLLEIVKDNRDRIDEINELLDLLGLSSERRNDHERRADVNAMLDSLAEERRRRRRGDKKPGEESAT